MQRISSNRTLISTSEATRIAGLSREHIQRLLRSSLIEGLKLCHDWLVYEDSLKAYLAKPRKPGPKGPRKASSQSSSSTPPGDREADKDD